MFGDTIDDMMVIMDNGVKSNQSVYSDRLWQMNPKKYDSCCMKVWGNEGQTFYGREFNDIEKFLKLYTENNDLILCRVLQTENVSNGYPLWRFDYKI